MTRIADRMIIRWLWKCCLLMVFFALSGNALAQKNKKITSQDTVLKRIVLTKELFLLKDTILDCHPNPYAFCDKQEFNKAFTDAANSIHDSTTYKEFIRIVGKALLVMKDSHTTLNYGYLQDVQLENEGAIPGFSLFSDKGNYYIEKDKTGTLPKGSTVECIANIPVEDIYKQVLLFSCIEGNAITGQRRVADAIFPIVAGLIIPMRDSLEVDVILPDSDSTITMKVPLLDRLQTRELRKTYYKSGFDSTFRVKWGNEGKYAYLKVGTFAPTNSVRFDRLLRDTFKEMKRRNTEQLILGSSGWVEYLYSFIDTIGYNTPHNIIARSSPLSRKRTSFQKPMNRWFMRTFFKKNENVMAFLQSYLSLDGVNDTIFFNVPEVQKKDRVFTGTTYLLINGLTASAGVDFTNVFMQRKRGLIVGEPCLGPVSGTFGNTTECVLPATGLVVNISTIRYNYDESFRYEEKPIFPDHLVVTQPADLATGRDTQLKFVESLILKK
jgi:hypothetical protein